DRANASSFVLFVPSWIFVPCASVHRIREIRGLYRCIVASETRIALKILPNLSTPSLPSGPARRSLGEGGANSADSEDSGAFCLPKVKSLSLSGRARRSYCEGGSMGRE